MVIEVNWGQRFLKNTQTVCVGMRNNIKLTKTNASMNQYLPTSDKGTFVKPLTNNAELSITEVDTVNLGIKLIFYLTAIMNTSQ